MENVRIKIKSPARILNPIGKKHRKIGKLLQLATSYGMSAKTAGERMGKSKEEGQELLDKFFAKFTGLHNCIEESKAFLKEKGYVEDWAGRRRRLPEINLPDYEAIYKDREKAQGMTFNPILGCTDRPPVDSKLKSYLNRAEQCKSNKDFDELAKEAYREGIILTANTGRKAQAERQCFNARIQGGAASLTKLAMINIYNDQRIKDYQAKLIIPVHDEVLVECPAFYADEVEKILPQIMIDTAKPYIEVGMKCDPYNVSRWAADEIAADILKRMSDLVEDSDNEYNRKLTRQEAANIIYLEYSEFEKSVIDAVLLGQTDQLEF